MEKEELERVYMKRLKIGLVVFSVGWVMVAAYVWAIRSMAWFIPGMGLCLMGLVILGNSVYLRLKMKRENPGYD